MNILVTGGTGFLGQRLVPRLGRSVRVFSESAPTFHGTVRDIVALQRAFPADIVYHLAASLDESDPEMYDINVEGTENVVRLCRKYKVKQLIFMSSPGVLGETLIPARETFPYNPKTLYEKSKAECERLVVESGVPYTIIRAPIILGTNKIWQSIVRQARRGYPIIGPGDNRFHLAHIDDVVDLLVRVRENKAALNQIFHVATKDIPTYREVYATIARELGAEMTTRQIGVRSARLYATLHTVSRQVRGQRPDVTKMRSSIDRLVRNRAVSVAKAREVLKFSPKYDTKRAIRQTVREMKEKKMI